MSTNSRDYDEYDLMPDNDDDNDSYEVLPSINGVVVTCAVSHTCPYCEYEKYDDPILYSKISNKLLDIHVNCDNCNKIYILDNNQLLDD